MSTRKDGSMTALETAEAVEAHAEDDRNVYLKHGRTLRVASAGLEELIEAFQASREDDLFGLGGFGRN